MNHVARIDDDDDLLDLACILQSLDAFEHRLFTGRNVEIVSVLRIRRLIDGIAGMRAVRTFSRASLKGNERDVRLYLQGIVEVGRNADGRSCRSLQALVVIPRRAVYFIACLRETVLQRSHLKVCRVAVNCDLLVGRSEGKRLFFVLQEDGALFYQIVVDLFGLLDEFRFPFLRVGKRALKVLGVYALRIFILLNLRSCGSQQ